MKHKKDDSDKNIISKEIIKDARVALGIDSKEPIQKIKKVIVYDGKQFAVRIPKKFTDAIGMNGTNFEKHSVLFSITMSKDRQSPPKITAEVIEE